MWLTLKTVPEKLHLLYPRSLAGRLETNNDIRSTAEVAVDPRDLIREPRHIDIDEVRELSKLVLRLEALCHPPPSPAHKSPPTSPSVPQLGAAMDLTPSKMTFGPGASKIVGVKLPPQTFLGPRISEDMGDEELSFVIDSLTGRAENCMSTLVSRTASPSCPRFTHRRTSRHLLTDLQYLKHLGGFSSVLAALEQATRIDQKLLVHAMALMDGVMALDRA